MLIRFTQDIKTKQTVYALVTADSREVAKYLTTNINKAIKLAQTTN
jgi:hypothetical protein